MTKQEFKNKYFSNNFYWVNKENYQQLQEIGIAMGCLCHTGEKSIIKWHKDFHNLAFRTKEDGLTYYQRENWLTETEEVTSIDEMVEVFMGGLEEDCTEKTEQPQQENKVSQTYLNRLGTQLIGDKTSVGGVLFEGERLYDFLEDMNYQEDELDDEKVNNLLVVNGILPLDDPQYNERTNTLTIELASWLASKKINKEMGEKFIEEYKHYFEVIEDFFLEKNIKL